MMRRYWIGARGCAALVLAAFGGGFAGAEVLEATGEFPARAREVSFLASLAVERFAGEDGPALAIAVERALVEPRADGAEFFDLRAPGARVEGAVSGTVATGVDTSRVREKRRRCVARDDKGKCSEEAEVEVGCTRRLVSVEADVRIVRMADGRILYSARKPESRTDTWCEGDSPAEGTETVVREALGRIAQAVRDDVVPRIDHYRIRVRESTRGMSREQADGFKLLVRQTKSDPAGACAGWAAMARDLPDHPSVLFDLGVCAEHGGSYAEAARFYRAAQAAGAGEAGDAAARADQLIAGAADARERARRRRR